MLGALSSLLGAGLSRQFYERPIFQVGASRSGTIVLYKALGTHPNIFSMPSEDPFITYIAATVEPFEFGNEIAYFEESVRLKRPYLYTQLRRLCFESAAGPNYGWKTHVKGLLRDKTDYFNKTHWCVKCFPLETNAYALMRLYPEARFIYIVRNGIDVVQSRTKFPAFRDQTFMSHCKFWVQAADKFDYLMSLPEAVAIRQEELLNEPDAVFERITSHLGLKQHPNPGNYVKTTLVHSRGDKATHENIDVRKSLQERPPSYETWDEAQRETFKQICGPAMEKLSYVIPF